MAWPSSPDPCGGNRNRRAACAAIASACLSLLACEADAPGPDGVRDHVRDSAGISIIQLRGEGQAPEATVTAASAAIGAAGESGDGAPFFHLVEDARRLGDGRIVVANRGTSEIIAIDSLGRRTGTIGRFGGGPGEFARLASIVITPGDTIVALDGAQRRVSRFAPDGTFLSDVSIRPPDGVASVGLAGAVGTTGPGAVVLWLQAQVTGGKLERLNQPHTVGEVPRILFVVDSTGRTVSVVGTFPGPEIYLGGFTTPSEGRVAANWGPAPFGIWTGFAVHNDRVFVLDAASNGFSLYTPDGRLLAIYRGTRLARAVTPGDRRLYLEALMKRHPAWSTTEEARSEYENIRYPESMPAFREVVVGTDGIVWIEPYELWNGAQRRFVGYDSTGLAVARLSLEYNDRIMEIGNGIVLLLNAEEDGVETIRVARYTF
jgi:hypothetical protein